MGILATRNSTDMQIREAFHMEKFVTMLAYDPKVRRVSQEE